MRHHLRLVAEDDDRRLREQIRMADHIASLGGYSVLQAMRAASAGQSIESVLQEFQTVPRWPGLRVVGVTP
jgi:hypothetical protein